jgi:hypothetical protein
MRRLLKHTVLGLLAATLTAFVLGIATVSAQLGLPQSNLACSDSTNLNLALDTTSLLALSNAVAAVNFFPAGDPALGCSLSQQSDPSGAHGPKDFAVGGGRIVTTTGSFNFAISAHATSDAATVTPQQGVGGTVNVTLTTDNSHLDTKVDCFVSPAPTDPTAGTAQATAVVTKSTGSFASSFPVGSEIRWDFFDSGMPGPAPNGDAWNGFQALAPCDFPFYSTFPITNGNINVKNDDF